MKKIKEDVFLSYTNYERLVDLKKLRFIFSSISRYAQTLGKDLDELTILEVGCGDGGITVPLGSIGCQVKAFDINQKAVKQTEDKLKENKFQNVVVSIDNGYTFNDNRQYDIVIASEVLEHLHDPFNFISNISQRLKFGGYFIVTVPNGFGPYELRNNLFKRFYSITTHSAINKIPGQRHLQFYRRTQLVNIISGYSFNLVDSLNSDSFFASLWISFIKPIVQLEQLDIRIADILPYWFASGWYMLFKKNSLL